MIRIDGLNQTAADARYQPISLHARKTADSTRNNTDVLATDPHLTIAVAANAVYEFEMFGWFDASSNADIKSAFTAPAGATVTWGPPIYSSSGGTIVYGSKLTSGSVIINGSGVGTARMLHFKGVLRTAGTAGNLVFQWAQGAAEATDTTLHAESYLVARKVA